MPFSAAETDMTAFPYEMAKDNEAGPVWSLSSAISRSHT